MSEIVAIPTNINRLHVIQAIEEIGINGIPSGGYSSTYDLIYENKVFPPKLVLSLANKFANGAILPRNNFSGGKGTPAFELLQNLGFKIHMKDPIPQLIKKYKKHIAKTRLKDERYKWELLSVFKGRPDTSVLNFTEELNAIDFGNLIYHMAPEVLNLLGKEKPEEMRSLFKNLFDETQHLKERIVAFSSGSKLLYKEFETTLPHHQDERSMATYLTFNNPERYTFYKNGIYKKYCELLGVETAPKKQCYVHYLHLINTLITDYIEKDHDLINQLRNLIPDYYTGENHLLLAQDILFQMLDKEETKKVNYWIFQASPKVFDVFQALRDKRINDWTVSSHKDKIQLGDQVILWVTGQESGCYAFGEITQKPFKKKFEENDDLLKKNSKIEFKAGIKITNNLIDNPILKSHLFDIKELKAFKGGNQGTNFIATEKEYNALLNMTEQSKTNYWLYAPGEQARLWNELYTFGEMALGNDKIDNLLDYISKDEIEKELLKSEPEKKRKYNDALACWQFVKEIQIGDVIICKKGKNSFVGWGVVEGEYFYDEQKKEYKHRRKVNWKNTGEWTIYSSDTVLKTLTNINAYPEYIDELKELLGIFKTTDQDKIVNQSEIINQILYGPPGTGKTHTLKNDYFPKYTVSETSISPEKHFENVVSKCSWWQVIAIALLEEGNSKVASIINNRWVATKELLSNSKSVRPTIWSQLQAHTVEDCDLVKVKNRQNPLVFSKTADSYWELLMDQVEELAPELLEIPKSIENFVPRSDKKIERYVFVTFHQSYSYEDFIEGIKPVVGTSETDANEGIGYRIEDGIFKKLCQEAANDPENRYAIFIDEINRGNVSAIFGELITLIEKDKRQGQANEMSVQLPYSKTTFSVPSNVDIYGTMNTADRSVEALDTALRRRFSFKELLPNPEVLKDKKVDAIDLKELLKTLNQRIEILLDREHTIGHSYFINISTLDELKAAFKDNIVPLLQEYFYGDYGKIGLVLGKGFVKLQKTVSNPFAAFNYEGKEELNRESYELIPIDDSFKIEKALELLLDKKGAH